MSTKSQIMFLIWFIIEFMNFKFSIEFEIESISPTAIRVNSKLEEIFLTLFLDQNITNRTETIIILKANGTEDKNCTALNNQDSKNNKKVYCRIDCKKYNYFKKSGDLNKYDVFLNYSESEARYKDKILIYENIIELVKPLNRYFLSNSNNQEKYRSTYFTFKKPIILEEINKITFYKEESETNEIALLPDFYSLDDNIYLTITLNQDDFDFNNVNTYIFNIYPEYDKNNTNAASQQFKIHFFDYLLQNDAIYVKKNSSSTNLNVAFTTNNENNLFNISEKLTGKDYPCNLYCGTSKNGIYNCSCELTIGKKDSPELFMIKYNSSQQTEMFLFPYQTNIEKCYLYNPLNSSKLYITVDLGEEIGDYSHDVFFYSADNNHKVFPDANDETYTITFNTFGSGTYNAYSVIPNLGNNENVIDKANLNLLIYPSQSSFQTGNSFLYSNTKEIQKFNISSSDGVSILEQFVLINQNKSGVNITVLQNEDCIVNGDSMSCNLTEKIKNKGKEVEGTYKIFYHDKCNTTKEILNRIITIKKGFNLLSISPTWINKSEVVGSNLILEYDTDLSEYTTEKLTIRLYDNKTDNYIEYNNSFTLESNKINLTLRDTSEGIYYVETIINIDQNDIRSCKDKTLIFKVSTSNINFVFDHHYFVLDNDDRNNLTISVNDSTGEFACEISEKNEKINLTKLKNCEKFQYEISKTGTIEFYYYDRDGFIIPINDSIFVAQTHTTYLKIDHKNCYYFSISLISLTISETYKDKMQIFTFLESDTSLNISLNNESYGYSFNVPLNKSEYLNANYTLFVTEGSPDREGAYLYKSDTIRITDLKVPEYIINPYFDVNFTDVKCDLSGSDFTIKNPELSVSTKLVNCNYNQNKYNLNCRLRPIFYSQNSYQYFSYLIGEKEIISFDKGETSFTFISNNLNESAFKITYTEDDNKNIYIKINNTDNNFYFPLLQSLNVYLNGDSKLTTYENGEYGFLIDNQSNTVFLNKSFGLKFKLDINNLKRKNIYNVSENDSSLYHYFTENEGRFIEKAFYNIHPTIFFFNDPYEKFNITIEFATKNLSELYNKTSNNLLNCSEIKENKKYYEKYCLVDIEKSKIPQNVNVSIISNANETEQSNTTIKFIYYSLPNNNSFTECVTKTPNMSNLSLYIDFPDTDLMDSVVLYNISEEISKSKVNATRITYDLKVDDIDLENPLYTIFLKDQEPYDFLLTEIGLKILPKYIIRFFSDSKTNYLLPENNQNISVNIYTNETSLFNLSDIKGLYLENANSSCNFNSSDLIEDSKLKVIFNLAEAENCENKTYILKYIDKCNDYIDTDNVTVEIGTFKFERNYFVLNNTLNSTQNLTIYGPYSDYITLRSYINGTINQEKINNNGTKYTLDITEPGNYTFEFINNGIVSSINDKVFVVENLEDLLEIYDPPSRCYFLNSDKSALENINFIIKNKIADSSKIFSKFSYKDDQDNFIDLDNFSATLDSKNFTLNYSKYKESINVSEELSIYITEKNDTKQPLYIYKYKYTDIELNSAYKECIYTDTAYIIFNMSCEINNLKTFKIKKNKTLPIKCEEFKYLNGNEYNCSLSSNDSTRNSLLSFVNNTYDYGIYDLYYDEYKLNNSSFNLSHEIATANFSLIKKSQIKGGANTNITIKSGPNKFYFPKIDLMTFLENKTNTIHNYSIISKKSDELEVMLFVVKGERYGLRKICRENCTFCRNDNCQYLNLDKNGTNLSNLIYDNTKDVTFYIDKHFIALNNSTTLKQTEVKITQIGKAYELELIDSIIYTYTNLTNGKIDNNSTPEDNVYTLNLTLPGKYNFSYKTAEGDINPIPNEVVLVSNYDYEIFDYTSLTKNCAYYNRSLGILVSITKNTSYHFSSDVNENKINILINDYYLFSYRTTEKTFRYVGDDDFPDYLGQSLSIKLVEEKYDMYGNQFYFTELPHLKLTNFSILYNTSDPFYYKDNILLKNQYCGLDNILISPDKGDESRSYYKLNCSYNDTTNTSFCETNYIFQNYFTKVFYFYIGEKSRQQIDINNQVTINNSIKDANFSVTLSNEIIEVKSDNFNMRYIDFILINNKSNCSFQINGNNSITISNCLNSSENITFNSLQRKNHPEDQSWTIKKKDINKPLKTQQIIKPCEEYTMRFSGYESLCLTCYEYYFYYVQNETRYYFQDNECVVDCNYSESYCKYGNLRVCKNSNIRTKQGNEYICGCIIGAVRSSTGDCYLPEDDEIMNELDRSPNLQCQLTPTIFNYCKNSENNINYTKSCITYRFSGYDFPKCICEDEYTGKYCEYEKKNISLTLNLNLEIIINNTKDEEISDKIEVITNIRGINYILENDKNDENYKNMSNDFIEKYIQYTQNKIVSLKNDTSKSVSGTIYDILDLCIYLMKKKIQYASENDNLRELYVTEADLKNYLKNLLDDIHYLHRQSYKDKNIANYNIQSSNLNQISFITYNKDKISSEDFKRSVNDTLGRIISYADIKTNNNNNNNIYVTVINRELIDNEEGVVAYISVKNDDISDISTPFLFYTSISEDFNYNLANYYHIKGIDIYDENHKAFTEPCFISENFPFDLTQKYRKNNVFQKKSLSISSCTYYGLDINANKVIFNCSGFDSITDCNNEKCGKLTVRTNNKTIKNANKVYNLPMRCPKKMSKKLDSNFGFWTFLVLIILEIIYCIGIQILTLGSLRKVSINKGCRNDDFCYGIIQQNANYPVTITEKDLTTEETLQKTRKSEKPTNLAQNYFQLQYEKEKESDKKKLMKTKLYTIDLCLKRNFKELHPVASLFRVSIITPLIMNSWFFIFNTINLFGFNALIYLESLIEKRIYDKNRDNFAYPMRKEFGKIILSILLQVILAIIFRLIVLISLDRRNRLNGEIKSCKDIIETSRKVSRFEKKVLLKRIIAGILMLVIYVFFFYYCVVFCGIYINTQRNWFFSGIWSLFWNWLVFSPIYIIIISLIEAKSRTSYTPSVYYMKKLFFF